VEKNLYTGLACELQCRRDGTGQFDDDRNEQHRHRAGQPKQLETSYAEKVARRWP